MSGACSDDNLVASSDSSDHSAPTLARRAGKKPGKKDAKNRDIDVMKRGIETDDHKISLREVIIRYETDTVTGLSSLTAKRKLEENGPNALTPPKTVPQWIKFLKQLFAGFAILLWAGAVLCFAAYGAQYADSDSPPGDNLYLGIVLVAVVVSTGVFTYCQEAASDKVMDSFKKLIPQQATVIRDSMKIAVPADQLVVGDIVEVKFGDRVPADIRVTYSQGFKVDNSSLTGECEPLLRSTDCTHDNPLETKNLAFFSTNVVEGIGQGLVIATGDNTMMGKIAGLATETGTSDTTLKKEMQFFVNIIIIASVIMGFVFLISLLALGYSWIIAFVFLIGIIMGNVPEGLLTTVTVILTLTAKRMAKKNCLVKTLECVETLGSTSVICSDKTGTLTQNRMTVAHLWYDNCIHDSDTSGGQFAMNDSVKTPSWHALAQIAVLCNRAEFKPGQNHLPVMRREVAGDASETALLKYTEMVVGNVMDVRSRFKKVAEIPFNSTNKFQVSVHELDGLHHVVMKGAPERVLDRCRTILDGGKEYELNKNRKKKFQNAYERLGGMGERVLGFSDVLLDPTQFPIGFAFDTENPNFPLDKFCFCGLISMIDPPRPNVPDAVINCREAGIRVVMVTGDHPVTAKAIAKSVNILSADSETKTDIAKRLRISVHDVDPRDARAVVVTGDELKNMDNDQLDEIIRNYAEIVFARTSPQQKLIIVEGFQRLDNIVAVTGDGVNDSPALKKSNIGIAMGITGSDVSKQAADMILLDDNFASIVTGIEEGRLIFENLKKTVAYTVTHITDETLPFLLFIFLEIPLPLGTICVLWIDLGTDIIPAITIAWEKAESDIMKRPPRDRKKETLVTGRLLGLTIFQVGIVESLGGMFVYFVIMAHYGFKPDKVIGLRDDWVNPIINNLEDSYGQEWTFAQRRLVEITCYTGYMAGVVIGQWVNIMCCKTRRISILEQGLVNLPLIGGLALEMSVIILLSFIPGMAMTLNFAPLRWYWFLAPIPFAMFILVYAEGRKLVARFWPNSFIAKEFLF